MSYLAPDGDAIEFDLSEEYAPPAGGALSFEMESLGIVQVPHLAFAQALHAPSAGAQVPHLAFAQALHAPSVQAGGAGTGLMMH